MPTATHFAARALTTVELTQLAFLLANQAAVAEVETNAHRVIAADGRIWWDVRPMLDEREQPAEHIDAHRAALACLEESGLIEIDRATPHMVRLLRRA